MRCHAKSRLMIFFRRDARSLPNTTRVINPYETFVPPSMSAARKPPHPCIPSEEWRASFEESFKAFRQVSGLIAVVYRY